MTIKDIHDKYDISFSFEFFPPKTEPGWDKLFTSVSDLMPLKPSWVSVTYGAGGSTRDRTHDLVMRIKRETDLTVVPHLTCVGSSHEEIHTILGRYADAGITDIFALRGDLPAGQTEYTVSEDGFPYALDLVAFIKKHYPQMCVGVAGFPEGHPDCRNRLTEIEHLKAKVDAGADYIITQLFFDNRDYYDYCERCELAGIHIPIIPGIMPITTKAGMIRMAELSGRARIPAPLLKAVERATDDHAVANVGVHWATEQVRDLVDNKVRGIHLYTLNTSRATLQIYEALGVQDSHQLAR